MRNKFLFVSFLFIITTPLVIYASSIEDSSKKQKLHLQFNYGYSYLIATPSDKADALQKEHIKELKKGKNLELALHYLIHPNHGLGIRYATFNSAANTHFNNDYDGDGISETGFYDEELLLDYYGLSLYEKYSLFKEKLFFTASFSAGILTYNDKFEYTNLTFPNTQPKNLTGSTFAYHTSLGLEVKLTKNIAIKLTPSVFIASFSHLRENGEKFKLDEKENVSRVNINAGISIYI